MGEINRLGSGISGSLRSGAQAKTQSRKTFFKKAVHRIVNFFKLPWGRRVRSEALHTAEKTAKSIPTDQQPGKTASRWLFRQMVKDVVVSHADVAQKLSGNTNIDLKQVTEEVTATVLRAKELKAEGNCNTEFEGLIDNQLILLATVVAVVENHTACFEKTMVMHGIVSSLSEKFSQSKAVQDSAQKPDETSLKASSDFGYSIQDISEPVETVNGADDFSPYVLVESMQELFASSAK